MFGTGRSQSQSCVHLQSTCSPPLSHGPSVIDSRKHRLVDSTGTTATVLDAEPWREIIAKLPASRLAPSPVACLRFFLAHTVLVNPADPTIYTSPPPLARRLSLTYHLTEATFWLITAPCQASI
ncbi:hypothetical protein BD289DRAFT_10821 [Coniella lustricola]|uniref:Uncharacterized protein n=1 Tax=Coniella lustricola TaxID=2025994 RepID=A0A2T3A4A6_9PEZI|nr:hypothetical protein BD289DRAFT_10821 [Coniella lustricola]